MMKTSSSLWLHLLILVISLTKFIYCGIHNSPGETQPPRVEIKINSSANITCRMNLTKFGGNVNSSSLYFVEEDTGRVVPSADIEILNETTIVFMLRNAVEQDRNYVCKSDKMGIGVTHVSVGTAPLDVTDFKCRGYDYTYMVCTFSIPNNVILTQYNLSYSAQSVLYRECVAAIDGKCVYKTYYSQNYIHICPLEVQENMAICNLTLSNNYRANYEFFNFTLTGRNDVGINTQTFWINNYESVIPPKPEYTIEKITNNSVVIIWYNVKYNSYTAKGLQYELRLRPKNGGADWMNHSNYEIRNNKSEYKIVVRNIPFAYFWFELSLRVRVKKSARNDDSYWSEPCIQEFQTAACAPETAPLTDVGSFYIDPTETKLRLYWHQLPDYKENGPEFDYVIKQVKIDGVIASMNSLYIDRGSAVFMWNRRRRYEFVIKSRNAVGESSNNSTIIIPAWPKRHERSMSPEWIRNVYHAGNRTYTLSWSPPTELNGLVDYTVFWCQSKRATPNECDDTIYFTHVNKNTTRYHSLPQKEEQTLNLAVSANYLDFNTGMHWTMCTADVASDLAKMEPEVISAAARSITVQWSSDRVCSSLLEGYNLTYCRLHHQYVSNADASTCMEDPITISIPSTAKKHEIKRLKPFSTYKIEVLMFSKLKQGKTSDPLIVNTTEEAPSKPQHLRAVNITSNSAFLTWTSPEHRNGILRKYRIEYNSEHHIIDCLVDESVCSPKLMTFQLENLSSYTRYKVYVVAYTTSASKHSNDINVETLVGIPSNPRHIKTKDNSHNILQWSEPEVPSGRVEFYQVAVIMWYKERKHRQHISNVVNSRECMFRLPVCIDADYRFTIQVRAVNVAKRDTEVDHYIYATKNITADDSDNLRINDAYVENEDLKCEGTGLDAQEQAVRVREYSDTKTYVQYTSVWEKGPVTNCSDTKLSRITMVALLVVVSSLGVMAAFYVARNKYLKMANISCALPPGLEAMAYPTKDVGDQGDFRRSKESFYNTESRHLLSSISHDSGYICHNGDHHNSGDTAMDGITPNSLGKSSGYIGSDRSTEYCNSDEVMGHNSVVDQAPSTDDAYMVMELLKPNDGNIKSSSSDHLLPRLENNCGYVQPSLMGIAALSGSKNTQTPPPFIPTGNGYITQIPAPNAAKVILSDNGYIKPHNILNWPTQKFPHMSSPSSTSTVSVPSYVEESNTESSGYVAPHMLQKSLIQPDTNGYISLPGLNKQFDPSHSSASHAFTQSLSGGRDSVSSIIPPISGYVTQKELSAFGQQQQIN